MDQVNTELTLAKGNERSIYHVSPFVSPGRRLEAVKVDECCEFLRWSGPHGRLFVSCADLRRPLGKFASPSLFQCHK